MMILLLTVFHLEQLLSDQLYIIHHQEAIILQNNNKNNSSSNGNPTITHTNNSVSDDTTANIEEEEEKIRINRVKRRLASSHCAINRNAQFTPHVDSGRGAGQSLSMIVGLGNYGGGGGRLMVEGISHDIRYKPLEFNGWKLRHWTEPFVGERFSLVWFTPEM